MYIDYSIQRESRAKWGSKKLSIVYRRHNGKRNIAGGPGIENCKKHRGREILLEPRRGSSEDSHPKQVKRCRRFCTEPRSGNIVAHAVMVA